jgi:hypothetical protein
MIQHLCEETSSVGTSGETEEIYIISRDIVPHEKFIAAHDMMVKRTANSTVFGFLILRIDSVNQARMRQGRRGDICSNARLVVVELAIVIAVQHAIDLQDIRIRIRARELVARAIETHDEFPPLTMGIRPICDGI